MWSSTKVGKTGELELQHGKESEYYLSDSLSSVASGFPGRESHQY